MSIQQSKKNIKTNKKKKFKSLKYFVPIKQSGGQKNQQPWLYPNYLKIKYVNNQHGPCWKYPNFTWPPTGSDYSNSKNFLNHLVEFPIN